MWICTHAHTHADLPACTHRFLNRTSQWSPLTAEQRSDGQRKKEAEELARMEEDRDRARERGRE